MASRKNMTYEKTSKAQGEILPEYDFPKGGRGKYAKGANVVVLDPDVAKAFPDAKLVNQSLRKLAKSLASSK